MPAMKILCKSLLILPLFLAATHYAKSQEFTSPVPECAREFYDPQMYHWISYENTCAGTINVALVGIGTPHSGALTIKPGHRGSPGMTAKEVEAVGGLKTFVCPGGYLPVNADDNKLIITKIPNRYVCKSTTIVAAGSRTAGSEASGTGTPGVQLLLAAQGYKGAVYQNGMKCSDLIIAASKAIGLQIPQAPSANGETMTESWFLHGMGPEFRAILTKVPLSEVAQKEGSGAINIPIGSVIVTDGHAALFDGVVKVGGKWELITFDANDFVGWSVSLSGVPSNIDPSDRMLAFPGHQVGEHVTRLQWGSNRIVSVYQPTGNHYE
jgi:hypothetical protein